MRHLSLSCLTLALVVPATSIGTARAQEVNSGGLGVRLILSEQALYEDGDLSARTDLNFRLSSRTRTQNLFFNLSTGIDKTSENGLEGEIEDPRLALRYGRQSRNAALDFNLGFRRSDIDRLTQIEDLDFTALVVDEGEREDRSVGFEFDFRREAPFGGSLTFGYTEIDYIDVIDDPRATNPLLDSTALNAALRLRFEISPVLTSFVTYSFGETDRDGGVDVERNALTVSAELAVSPTLTATADLGYTEVIRSGSVARSTEDGLLFGASLVLERPNGTISGILDSDIDENGRRSSLELNRQLDLKDGALSAGIGFSRNDETDSTDPLYTLNYVRFLPNGQARVGFNQAFTTNSAGTETLDSRLTLGLNQALSPLSRINTSFSWRESNVLTSGGRNSEQMSFNVDYSRTLAEDWDMFAGLSHIRRQQAGQPSDTEDQVFFGIRTTLGWRP